MSNDWTLAYRGLDRDNEGLREALCTLGNGVFATRGAAEERRADEIHYPGNYVAGGYNELASEIAGRTVVNEDLVNFPDWLWLTFRPWKGPWLNLWEMEVLEYCQELDMKQGMLRRLLRVRDDQGRETSIVSRRIVHMDEHHLAAIQWRMTPHNWSGRIEIESGLDASVTNDNVERYRQLESKHLEVIDGGTVAPEGIYLKVRTNQSGIVLAQASRTRIRHVDEPEVRRRIDDEHPERIAEQIYFDVTQGQQFFVEKVVSQFTSRDRGIGEPATTAKLAADDAADFEELLDSHRAAWARLWRRCDVDVEIAPDVQGPTHDQLVLRLHIFHLLQTASPNTVGYDVGIPARGLHGEAYRGHIFWDELFILPFYLLRLPSVARSTIMYRYHRLDAARTLAREAGCRGAAFPWQSGSDGREATQQWHLNPMSGQWDPDYSHLQRHINSAVAYNVWKYYEATADRLFMEEYGAEILLEIARFWASLATYDDDTDRYHISGVMGPDEYHEKYPDADRGGLRNNVYTNITALWCLLRAMDVLEVISSRRARELRQMLSISDRELERWDHVSRRMIVVFHDGVLSQFEGYDELEELDWPAYVEEYDNIERLDRILKAEGDTPDRYKVSKQADVTMLLYLFRPEELRALMERLGYELSDEDMSRNIEYYRSRTSHGSTLSRVVHTSVIHRQDCEQGAHLFLAALESDLYDVQGGTTQEGVHLGAMAGTIDIIKRYYAGLTISTEGLSFSPHLPHRMQRIAFPVFFQRRWYDVLLTQESIRISIDEAEDEDVTIGVEDKDYVLSPGQSIQVEIEHPHEGELRPVEDEEFDGGLAPPIRLATEEQRPPWPPGTCGDGAGVPG